MLVYALMYKRILFKVSGEQFSGEYEFGVDPAVGRYLAAEANKVIQAGCQLVFIIGGGNVVRGADKAGNGIKRVTADQLGMLSGLMNAMAMTDIFESEGVPTRCMSAIYATQVAEAYSFRLAEKHLERGRIVMIAGGMGRPYFTHDTAAVSYGLELGCDLILKATKVEGVYDKDPMKHKDAKLYKELTYQQALENENIKVMDKAALGLALEQNATMAVINAFEPDNLLRAAKGEKIGTLLKNT